VKSALPERVKRTMMNAMGLSVFFIGITGAVQASLTASSVGSLDRQFVMHMILSLLVGGIIGECIRLEDRLSRLGNIAQHVFKSTDSHFSKGFVSASLIFCVGAMAIVGSMDDGISGDRSILYAKAVLDGIISMILASTMGIGVAFSAIPVLLYQGGITFGALALKPALTPPVIAEMSLVGSVLISGIGINMLGIKDLRIGNLLPSVFIPLLRYGALALFAVLKELI
jgi:uncharacterized membrane protein YqgA involved in biofilm formation